MAATRFELLIESAGSDALCVPLAGELTIGRDGACDVVLTDTSVSRHHCLLRTNGDGVVLRDLGSSHGTLVDGLPITQVKLVGGESIVLSPSSTILLRRVAAGASTVSESVPRPSVKRGPSQIARALKFVCIWGVAGTCAFGMWMFFESREARVDTEAGFAAALDLSQSHTRLGQFAESEAALEQALARGPQAPMEARLRSALEATRALLERRSEALGTLQAMALSPAFASRAEFESAMEAARPTEPRTLIADAVFAELLNQGRETYVRRAQARATAARVDAQEALAARRHGAALLILDQAALDPSLDEAGRLRLRSLRQRAESEAEAEHDALLPEVRGMQPELARKTLNEALSRFEGTRHEGALRALLGLLPEAATESASGPASGTEVLVAVSGAAMDALALAEGVAARREFDEAARAFSLAAAAATSTASREHCERRRERMQDLAKLPQFLSEALAANPARFRGISLGQDARGDLKSVTERELVFQVGVGARQTLTWARFGPERQALLFSAARFNGESALVAAQWLLELREPARALDLLAAAATREPAFAATAMALVAECKGQRGVPLGGFELFAGTFMSSTERQRFVADRRLEECAKTVESAEGLPFEVALDELRNAGAAGHTAAVQALRLRRDRLLQDPQALSGLSGGELLKTRAKLRKELDEARVHALELIMDAKRYPYPYGPDQAAVQADVDGRILRVEELWTNPSRRALELVPAANAGWQRVEQCTRALESLGVEEGDPTAFLEAMDDLLGIATVALDDRDAEKLAHREELSVLSRESGEDMSPAERECHEATNAYRVMMGFDPVLPDGRLVNCARGHSEEMKKLGYFSHTSPTKGREDPGRRAKLAGWGQGVSENIAMGQATGASSVSAWRGSSGHHRNLLGNWTHLGCGKAETAAYWTQNFSRGPVPKAASKRPPKSSRGSAPKGIGSEDRGQDK